MILSPAGTTPVGGATVEITGTLTFSPGREVTSSSIEIAPGQTQPLMISGPSWRVTIPLLQGIEAQRSFTITTIDASSQSTTTLVPLTIDTLAPRLALTVPMATIAVGSMAMLSGTVEDTSSVSSLTVDVGAGPVAATITGTTWSATVPFPAGIDRVNRPATITATDAATNVASISPQILVDTQGPAVAFMSPAASERIGVPRMQTITGSITDAAGLGAVSLDCADGAGPRMATVTGVTWTVTWPLPTADNVSSMCTVRAADGLGNTSTATRSFFVDTVAPVVTITSPTANAILGGPRSTVTVTATVTDGSNAFGTVTLGFDGMTQTPTGASPFSGTFTLPTVDFVGGTATAQASDAEGNVSSVVSVMVTVDRVAPQLTITAPTPNQPFNVADFPSGNDVNMTWTVSDGDPTAGTRNFNGAAVASGLRTTPVATSASDNGAAYTRTVDAVDRAGNVSTLASRTFFVDRVRPTVVATAPANDTRMNDPRVASVTFSEAMITSATGLVGAGGGTWNLAQRTWTSSPLPGSAVAAVTVRSSVTDSYGNTPSTLPAWRFHTAPVLPPNGTVITSGASPLWDVTSDPDGLPVIAAVESATGAGNTFSLVGTDGTWQTNRNGLAIPAPVTNDITVNVWGTVGSDLRLSRRLTVYSSSGYSFYDDGTWGGLGFDLPVVTPPIEALDGTEPIGAIYTASPGYARPPSATRAMPFLPTRLIVSPAGWFFVSTTGTTLNVGIWKCANDSLSGTRRCDFAAGNAPEAVASAQTAVGAISPAGCGVVAYGPGTARRATLANFALNFPSAIGSPFTSFAVGSHFSVARRSVGGLWAAEALMATTPGLVTYEIKRLTNCSLAAPTYVAEKQITVQDRFSFGRVVELPNTVGLVLYDQTSGLLSLYY